MSPRAPLAVSMGDPTGIGPEVLVKALAARPGLDPVVFGDPETLAAAAHAAGVPAPARIQPAGPGGGHIPGAPGPRSGTAQVAALAAAVDAVLQGQCGGLVTAPIHKLSAHAAGFAYPGHTEYRAARGQASRWAMMFASPAPGSLRLVLTTIHVPLADVPRLVTPAAVADAIVLCARALRQDFGVPSPRIAVCGLNPHAGEGGAFGREEAEAIVPGIERACAELREPGLAIAISGPEVPDAVFRAAAVGAYDAVVCQYHDQGLIPFKLRHFDDGVNVTLGLPFVRTSPDHGTAHDIAGRGQASPGSMIAALDLCAAMVQRRVTTPGA
ncbi:MAG: 4-hydroxythreonine-4-phosphate dehydrogenase PdxA [Deltaproteobacteria bacterium]|nr:4-hydroxythreonine-4-phosphate dehydrogenase PdxA [Deltaproteobacteria bacterium]